MATNKEVKQMLGKPVEWEEAHDHARGTCLVRRGTVQEVRGQNVCIDGDWRGVKSLVNLKLAVVE